MESKYVNEKNYKRVRKIFILLYVILLILGIFVFIYGLLAFKNEKNIPFVNVFLMLCGLCMVAVSGDGIIKHAFSRNIAGYYIQQKMPVAKEGIEQMAPTIGKAAGDIAKGIKEGLSSSNDNNSNNQ